MFPEGWKLSVIPACQPAWKKTLPSSIQPFLHIYLSVTEEEVSGALIYPKSVDAYQNLLNIPLKATQ